MIEGLPIEKGRTESKGERALRFILALAISTAAAAAVHNQPTEIGTENRASIGFPDGTIFDSLKFHINR